jgi:cytochrome c oxidase subunit 2
MTQSVLHPAGAQAGHIHDLWWFMFWICAAVFVIVMAFLLAAIFRRRAWVLVGHPTPPDAAQERRLSGVVGAAAGVTTLILFVFLIASFLTERTVSALNAPDALTIAVTGHQWWWEIQYPDSDPSKIVRTANEIHIPAGRPIRIKLATRDVIHSFWVPALHGKRDMIPGEENEIWLQADQPGRYDGQCAEFCGFQHAHMRLLVIAESPDQFSAWLDAQRQAAHAPDTPEQIHGQQVFMGTSCILCHTIRGTPAAATNGPDLTHVGRRQTLAAGAIPNTRGHLGGWIVDSQAIKPGNHMPSHNLSGPDLQDLLAYVESLK